jgi:hypothetical protein
LGKFAIYHLANSDIDGIKGGLRIYPSKFVPQLLNATERFFYDNKDPKSGLITTVNGDALGTSVFVLYFHDGPEKPEIFDMFDGIPTVLDNTGKKSFLSLIQSFPSYLVQNARGTFATISTSELTTRFLEAVRQEAEVRSTYPASRANLVNSI